MDEYIIKSKNSTFWEETYGCSIKYKCAVDIYLMKILSLTLKNTDREIGAPDHWKDVVYGINKRDRIILGNN